MEEHEVYFYFTITNNATINNLPYMLFQIYGCVSSGKIPTSETAKLKRKYTQLDEISCFDQWSTVFKRKCLIRKI